MPVPEGEAYEVIAMNTMRKVIAERMAHSKSNVPHFYLTVDCEIDELLKVRKALNEKLPDDGKLSVNDFIIRACALALMEVPDANAGWEGPGQMRRLSRIAGQRVPNTVVIWVMTMAVSVIYH